MLASPGGDLGRLCEDSRWSASIKMDGHRLVVVVEPGRVQFLSRTSKPLPVAQRIVDAFNLALPADSRWVFDGEYMPKDEHFYVFDIPEIRTAGTVLIDKHTEFSVRHEALTHTIPVLGSQHVSTIPLWTTTIDKRAAAEHIREAGGEGLVFKRNDSKYQFGRRSPLWLKVKFVKDVDCVVVGANRDGKKNWVLAVNDGAAWHEIGEVSGLTGDADQIEIGSVVTVQCLYASEDNRLVQPVTPRLRHDKDPLECTLDQLQSIRANRNLSSLLGAS